MKTLTYPLFLSVLLGVLHLTPTDLRADENLTFGAYAADKPSTVFKQFKPILDHVETSASKALGTTVKIKFRIFKGYEEANDALVKGEVDFARFGPASYIIAKAKNDGLRLLAIEEEDDARVFQGVILVRNDSPIQTPGDLAGRSFAFGDENSTIGRFLSQALLFEAGITAKSLSRYEYLDRHDKVVTAVLNGNFDAGAAKEGTFRKYEKEGLRTIAVFDNVTKPWVVREGLDPKVFKALQRALLDARDSEMLEAIGKGVTGFGKVSDSEYAAIRRGMKVAEGFFGPEAKVTQGGSESSSRATAGLEEVPHDIKPPPAAASTPPGGLRG